MPSKIGMKFMPNFKLSRLMGGWMPALQALVELMAKCQILQAAGSLDALQALVELMAKCQTLQAAG